MHPHTRDAMDAKAKVVHEQLEQKLISVEDHNRRIGEICAAHAGDARITVTSHCIMCRCLAFEDAGEIGVLAERLARVEQRLDKIEHPKVEITKDNGGTPS